MKIVGIVAHPGLVNDSGLPLRHQVVSTPYIRAVERAGALPVLLPVAAIDNPTSLLAAVDAVVLTGGPDIDPARYGAIPHPETVPADPERDDVELAFARTLVERNVPTLAICRGIQVLNVAMGGTLHQHRPEHMQRDRYNVDAHTVTVDPASRLHTLVAAGLDGDVLGVNTLHHQQVDRLGEGLRVAAHAPDGAIEAIEVEGAPAVLAVQWHPEMLRHRDEQVALFRALLT